MATENNRGQIVADSDSRIRLAPVSEGADRPLWSVMVPTFNCARFLRQTLECVLSQDPGPDVMQIEVVDDCSTQDDPESVVRAVAGDRVQFYRQPKNLGHTRNFETCLQHARGHLVHLLHGDDAVRPGFYDRIGRAFAANQQIGAAFCRYIMVDADDNWISLGDLEARKSGVLADLVDRLALRQRIQTPGIVVRREVYEAIGSFDRRLSWTEDWEMWARIAAHYPVWYEVEALALYRVHDGSNTARYTGTGENLRDLDRLFRILELYVPEGRGRRLCQQGRQEYAIRGLAAARAMLGARDAAAARAQVRAALKLSFSLPVIAFSLELAGWAAWRGIRHLLSGTLRAGLHQRQN